MKNIINTYILTGKTLVTFCLLLLISVSFVGAQEKSEPRSGEGVAAFLRRHGRPDTEVFQEQFIELNKKKLGRNNSLKLGFEYVLPPLPGGKTPATQVNEPKRNDDPRHKETVSTSDASTSEGSYPHKGEGIEVFLKRHKRQGVAYQKQFIELNKERLGKDNSLKLDTYYLLPPLSGQVAQPERTEDKPVKKEASFKEVKRKEPLFGKKYEEYTVKSGRLAGACIYLSSGHGGPDCGAIGKVGNMELYEDEYAYDVTLRLARALMEEGATVHLIIQDSKNGIRDAKYLDKDETETCMGDPIPLNNAQRLKQRVDKINRLSRTAKEEYQRAFFIHLDSQSKKHQVDVYFYYLNEYPDSKSFSDNLLSTIEDQYRKHQPNRPFGGSVYFRSLYVLKNTNVTSSFAELGNIQNTFDQRRFVEKDNRQALANWLCRGFINDYEEWKKKKK